MTWYQALRMIDPIGCLRPFWHDAARNIYRLLSEREFRYYLWLILKYGRTPRFCQRTISVRRWTLSVPDLASFFSAYREIFVDNIYAFPSQRSNPLILDCGSNIGLSVLYFKKSYPDAMIVAYEADPAIYRILEQNVSANGIRNVELHNQAVWSDPGAIDFSVEGADGGRINAGKDGNIISVPAVALSTIIDGRRFAFVKIDIEGAETSALKGCDHFLAKSDYYFIEFHSFQHRKQDLGRIIDMFERAGFRVHIHPPFTAKRPFFGIRGTYGMDMQLNLFFWKDEHAAT